MIAVDVGNSRIKIRIDGKRDRNRNEIPRSVVFTSPVAEYASQLSTFTSQLSTRHIWYIAPTGSRFDYGQFLALLRQLRPADTFILMKNADIPLPVRSDAPNPDCIGIDRMLGAYGAIIEERDMQRNGISRKKILIADAGSAVTVDLVENGVYQGGATLPGFRFLAETYPKIAATLPLMDVAQINMPPFPCRTTEESIEAGLFWMLVGAIRQYADMCEPDAVYLTGGDGELLHSGLQPYFPAEQLVSRPGLVLDGIVSVCVP